MWIRILDIVFSACALLVLTPFLLPIVAILSVTGEREIFFLQDRVGRDGKLFRVIKFATMLKDSPNIGPGLLTVKDDPRVLPFGRFLRKTKVNELPQLINVLKGDMSVIGPRPQAQPHFDVFPAHVREAMKTERPGLSGIGSIVFRNEEELLSKRSADSKRFYAEVIAPYKGELELWFIRRRSVWLYLILIALTVCAIAVPSNRLHKRILRDLPQAPAELGSISGG